MQPPFVHVIFDWSGTLYDDQTPSFLATRQTILDLGGRRITRADYDREFTLPALAFYRRYGVTEPGAAIDRRYFSAYERVIDRGKLFPGVREALESLARQRIPTSLFSTLRQDLLEAACAACGIRGLVGEIQGSVPDKVRGMPDHLERIGRRARADVLFIGDTEHDLEAARRHGLTAGCVLSGYHGMNRLLAARPRFAWREPADWPAFFAPRPARPGRVARDHPVATVGALISNPAGKVLLVLTHKWSHTYGIPGGKIEKGEGAVAALRREIREETGLAISGVELVLVQDCIDPPEFYVPGSHFLLFNYAARTRGTRVRLNDESLSYLWVEPRAALDLHLNEPTRTLIQAVLDRVPAPSA
ncbi:MAG: NUDIX domain-containing protein [Planctomycetia bacterium]|nr:NUDIX domain-containing protein [Planctomycetia bacterium]